MNDHLPTPGDERFNPFPGLRPFRMDEEYLFFGRETQCSDLITRLSKQKFLGVLGASGSGKSSLVRAGLLPALYGGSLPGAGSHWSVAVMRPGGDPIGNLAESLLESELWDDFDEDDDTLPDRLDLETTLQRSALGLRETAKLARMPEGHNLLVVVDQFEELFRFSNSANVDQRDEAEAFVSLLIEGARQEQFSIYVVLTMRSDFFGDCASFESLAQVINDGDYLVPRLTREQLKDAIEGPIRVGGAEMAPALVQRLLNDAGDDPDQLPILQHAMMRTWNHWKSEGQNPGSGPITHVHYEAIGGTESALSLHADEVMATLPNDRQRIAAQRMFKALTERAADNRGIRRPHRLGRLCEITEGSEADVAAVVNAFRKPGVTFLMPGVEEELTAATVVDISHESFMRHWKRMDQWVHEEHQSASIYHRLLESALLWKQGRADLYHNPDLQIAQAWREHVHPNAAWAGQYGGNFDTAMEFLERSHSAKAHEEERREVGQQRELAQAKEIADVRSRSAKKARVFAFMLGVLAVLLGALAVVAFVLLFYAIGQTQKAQLQQRAAEAARAEADLAKDKLAGTFSHSTNVQGQQAAEEGRYSEALAYFSQTLAMDPRQTAAADRVYSILTQVSLPGLYMTIQDKRELQSVAFSPDGNWLATGSRDDHLRVFDLDTGTQVFSWGFEDKRVTSVAFSKDGRLVAAGNRDAKAAVFNVATGERVGPILEHRDEVRAVALNSNATLLATGTGLTDFKVRIWLIETGLQRFEFDHGGDINEVHFAPQENLVLSASEDGTAKLWDAVTGELLHTMKHNAAVATANFNATGDLIVTASGDDTARVWNTETGLPESEPMRHDREVTDAAFSPDSNFILTASEDKQARLWEAASAQLVHPPWSHRETVNDVTFSPDGMLAVSASDDKTVRLRDVATGKEISGSPLIHSDEVKQVEFSLDGRRLVTRANKDARVWGFEERRRFPIVMGGRQVVTAALKPGGSVVATGSADGTVAVWDTATGKQAWPTPGLAHRGKVLHMAFNQRGNYLVSSGEDGRVCVWDTGTGSLVSGPMMHKDQVNWVEFSPDSKTIATASESNRVFIWGAEDGKLRHQIVLGDCSSVTFSKNGERILAASHANMARLISTRNGAVTGAVFRHDADVLRALYSPNGRYVATASADHTGRILDAQTLLPSPQGLPLEHHNEIRCIDFSADSSMVVTGSSDSSARIWSVPDGKDRARPLRHDGPVLWVAFSPAGTRVLTCSEDGTARVWDAFDGSPASQRLQHGGPVTFGQFGPDGRNVLTVCADGLARIWRVGLGDSLTYVPREFTRFAEATGGVRLSDRNALEAMNSDERTEVFTDLVRRSADRNSYIAFASEYATQHYSRSRDQGAREQMSEYLEALIESDTLLNMETVLEVWPDHALALAKRAALRLSGGGSITKLEPQSRADIERAEQLGSADPEVLVHLGIAYLRLQEPEQSLRVFDTALELSEEGNFTTLSEDRLLERIADAFEALAAQASEAGDEQRAVHALRTALLTHVRLNPGSQPIEGTRWEMTRDQLFQWEQERETLPAPVVIIPKKSEWSYNIYAEKDRWTKPFFNDDEWGRAIGVIGFSDEHIATTIRRNGTGDNSSDSWTTFYFRRPFTIESPSEIESLRVSLLRDDGARIFLNGTEVKRDNLPEGDINEDTFALKTVKLADETRYWDYSIDAEHLVSGKNVLAVEVKQSLPDSSDLGFDLELIANVPSPAAYLKKTGLGDLDEYLRQEGENLARFLEKEAFPSVVED
jgi:WD40 repeat protein/tetratricopeptide (TPR) repeat protein/energy-coupling factor transporter ATP-binding protein EcfA2